jgi:DsbC/DsbD-like thiol-disulfide interchange protein
MILAAVLMLAGEWSAPVEVRHDETLCLTYRARYTGTHLVVEIAPEPGWHTFSMDNKQRQTAALKGRMSLGAEKPTTVAVGAGATLEGEWMQSAPEDFSKPDIQWYSYGFSKPATLAAKARASAAATELTIKGQACSDSVCKNVETTLKVDLTPGSPADLAALTPLVR